MRNSDILGGVAATGALVTADKALAPFRCTQPSNVSHYLQASIWLLRYALYHKFCQVEKHIKSAHFHSVPPLESEVLQVFGTSANAASGPTCPAKVQGLAGLIGNTPLVRIESLSQATGCEVNASSASPATKSCVHKPCAVLAVNPV